MISKSSATWFAMGLVAFGTGAISRDHARPLIAAAVPVRYPEGTVHGFLELTTDAGALLAHGDLLQISRNGGIQSRMIFRFAGSVFEETVEYTQHEVFALQTYHLVQSGPAFEQDLDATLSRTGSYVVRTKSHKDGAAREFEGSLNLPADVYNGMMGTIAKNVSTQSSTRVHVVAFMPEPRIVEIEIAPSGTERVRLGKREESTVNFVIKPKLGILLRAGAKIAGKLPSDSHIWIVTDEVPAFVRSEGPLYSGPVWRIGLVSPAFPR